MPTGERPGVVGDGPPCPYCDRSAYQLRRFIRGKAPQRLEVAICFGCGHVLGLTEGTDSTATATASAVRADASEGDSNAAQADAAGAPPADAMVPVDADEADAAGVAVPDSMAPHRFVRFPQTQADPYGDDEAASGERGFHTLERWEIAQLLLLAIAMLLLLNAFIWYQRGKETGLF